MANGHVNFINFEKSISLTPAKKQKLISSRVALQKKIVEYFRGVPGFTVPKFYIQGSYKMETMVVGKDGTYDVDLGVYFLQKPLLTSSTVKRHLYNAVVNHTYRGAENRDKCVRVIYAGDFDIDLPVYYKTMYNMHPFLATKLTWTESDPKELCDWFKRKRDRNGQLIRVIKYFKYWANIRDKKMPNGIAFTVWAANNFVANSRDDVAFYETAKAIRNSIYWSTTCRNPATPNDDFLDKLSSIQKSNFKLSLDSLINDASQAIETRDGTIAYRLWRRQLGLKFL